MRNPQPLSIQAETKHTSVGRHPKEAKEAKEWGQGEKGGRPKRGFEVGSYLEDITNS